MSAYDFVECPGDAVPPLMAAHILASVGAGQLASEAVA